MPQPAVMISNAAGAALQNLLDAKPRSNVTINPTVVEQPLTVYNQLASFSSQGPVTGTAALKPDLLAVGTNMYMAAETYDPLGEVYGANGYTVASGTSFATPMVTGAAALVKQSHPNWTAAQVKSALVNSATQDVSQDDSGHNVTVQSIGAGKLDAGLAVAATVTASPATISFGAITRLPTSQQILLTNNGSATVTLAIANDNTNGARQRSTELQPDQPDASRRRVVDLDSQSRRQPFRPPDLIPEASPSPAPMSRCACPISTWSRAA